MFKLQELPNGNVLAFYVSTGELAMIISSDKENVEVSQGAAAAGKAMTRSTSGKQFSTSNSILHLNDQYFPYVNLHKLPSCNEGGVLAPHNVYEKKMHLESLNYVKKESNEPTHTKESFLGLFGLQPTGQAANTPVDPLANTTTNSVASTSENGTRQKFINLSRLDFSSELGQLAASRIPSKTSGETTSHSQPQVPRFEFYCGDTRCTRGEDNFPVVYREDYNYHQSSSNDRFCLSSNQKLERRRRLKYGLSTRSRWLRTQCKRCSVPVFKLSEVAIKDWLSRKDPVKPKSVVCKDGRIETELVIDGTIVIQLDDSDDESSVVSAARPIAKVAAYPHQFERAASAKHPSFGQLDRPLSVDGRQLNGKGYRLPLTTHLMKRKTNSAAIEEDRTWMISPRVTVINDVAEIAAKKAKLCSNVHLRDASKTAAPEPTHAGTSRPLNLYTAESYAKANACESSSDDDDVVCLGLTLASATKVGSVSDTGQDFAAATSNVGVSQNDRTGTTGSVDAAMTSALINCFIPLEQRGVSVHLASNNPSSSSADRSSWKGNHDYVHNRHTSRNSVNGGDLVNLRTTKTDAAMEVSATVDGPPPESSVNASKATVVKPSSKRCLFECLNCNIREEYLTNATRNIHDHILRCFTSFEKVSLVTNLDQFEHHGVIHVQAL